MSSSPTDDLIHRLLAAAAGVAQSRAEALVGEARAEAESEVKALAKSAMKAALLRAALEQLERMPGDSQPPPSITPVAAAPTPERRKVDALPPPRELEATRTTDGDATRGWYIYGITRRDAALPDEEIGVAASSLDAITDGDLQAIVSHVPLDALGATGDDTQSEQSPADVKALQENVLAHDRVLRAAVERGGVLPFRFGTVVRQRDDVRRLLADHATRFAQTLAALDRKKEWGVRLAARVDPALLEEASPAPTPTSGRAYLQRKKQADQSLARADRAAADRIAEAHRQLAAISAAAVELPASARATEETSPRQRKLNAAYLVAEVDEPRFQQLVSTLAEQWASKGLTCTLTGPWPPYNFSRLDLGRRPHEGAGPQI